MPDRQHYTSLSSLLRSERSRIAPSPSAEIPVLVAVLTEFQSSRNRLGNLVRKCVAPKLKGSARAYELPKFVYLTQSQLRAVPIC